MLVLRRKAMTNLDSILKSRDITFPTKVFIVKAMVFPVVMYGWVAWWLRWQRICLQCRRPMFDYWFRKIPWRREWQPTPLCLPGEIHGQSSLPGYSPWGRKQSDTTEWLTLSRTDVRVGPHKKAKCWRTSAFKLCWRRLLRVPWTARRSNQSVLKEISLNIHWKDCCWSWNSKTLATWCEGPAH